MLQDVATLRIALAGVAVLWAISLDARAGDVKTVDEVAAELANPLAPVTTLSGNLRAEMGNGPEFVNPGLAYVNYLERPQGAMKSEIRISATYVWR